VISVLLVVYSLGKIIGARTRESALASARSWTSSVRTCRLVDERVVDIATIVPGDRVEVRAGETIGVDGVIREGTGFVSEAPVNGEPFAVVKRPGDRVLAGSNSHDAVLRIEATAAGRARQIDKLIEAVEAARSRPTSLQAQADRLGRIFFPVIVAVAIVIFGIWTQIAGWQTGLFNAMSVLLVACPCALGLATPIVLWSALNRLAERGLIVHSGDAVERLAQVDCVIFDKTGTLTDEQFGIVDIATLAEGDERASLLRWLAAIEARSNHPIARPFAALTYRLAEATTPRIIAHRTIPGCGIEAEIQDRGSVHRLRVGRAGWLQSSNGHEANALLARLLAQHGHRIDFEVDGKMAGIALVSERLRDSALETVETLQNMGLSVKVLTGDAAERAIALGFADGEGDLLPDDKRQRVEQAGRALMIGDGINDASALATAHVGIALASGADLANSAATASLHHGDLRTIPWAIELSRQAMQTVRRNLLRAATYNLIGIALAAFGVLHPIAAALLMVVSSLWVAWSSVRVGVDAAICPHDVPTNRLPNSSFATPAAVRAIIHALAFAGQVICAALLVRLTPATLVTLAALVLISACIASYWWFRAQNVPHWLDMSFGMLTLGNLGMLLGWWADNGFARLHDAGCCSCVEAMRAGLFKPWMLVGMLVGANLAMFCLARRPAFVAPRCAIAMYTGGNVGMILGMLAGGWSAAGIEMDSVSHAALLSYAGMTAGMIAGMPLGTAASRWLIAALTGSAENRVHGTNTRKDQQHHLSA
jgi:heavy metal translocating P-type ATPase